MGITGWYTARNGQWYGQIADMAAWADPNVTPNKTYTYSVAPENIDMASGNLNLTIPLLRPQGRGGWSVPIALTYKLQPVPFSF